MSAVTLILIGCTFIALLLAFCSFFLVEQQTAVVVERFGRFHKIAHAGLNVKIPFVDSIPGHISLRIKQLDVTVETKTQDDVFVNIVTSVQYRVLEDKLFEAFYVLDDAHQQIQAFVFDVVRARVPHIKLDDVFSKKDDIANSVKDELQEVMEDFGYGIIKTLVTDIHPDDRVKKAMNEINEAQRLRIASMERGEAEKILRVKQAEAEAESKILQGQGVAGQRKAIIDGLRTSLGELQQDMHEATPQDVMALVLMTQYFDTLRDMGVHGSSHTILLPHSPGAMGDLYEQIRNAVITGQQVGRTPTS